MELNAFAKLIARAVSVYLLVESTFLLLELPQAILSVLHHAYYVHLQVALAGPISDATYWAAYYTYGLVRILVLLTLGLFFAYHFYKPSPRVLAYLLGAPSARAGDTEGEG